ncbi:Multidrug resistance-associated protein 1 [Mortierella sp. GBA43]|nr:Multidrug resistance-associated protein 1 [Mortierella sp. GBA43]
MVGLTLSFTLAITEDVTSVVRITSDLQNFLISVERIMEYTNMGTEAPEHTDVQLPPGWPNKGHIQFHHYSTRYREGLDLVVKDISIDIQPSESIGIVGRTGAGKSSLALALFRIVEAANSYWAKASDNIESPTSDSTATTPTIDQGGTGDHEEEELDGGRIEIDGIDISKVGLEDLRKSISIIPQDPILFAGTVRDNLDPFQEQDDASLWEALGQSNLKDHISSLPGGLEHEVSQNGENFSVGQRSLMCLARALLRKTKILIMDEATAAVDVETDELIQNTIRDVFQGIRKTTVLTIAHRIKTVMDSDKILVLDQGRVLEFESPDVLLQVQAGQETLFYQLAKQAGEI